MSDVTEDDAAMAFVLNGKIRELVRKHLKEALEDPSFIGSLNTFPLAQSTQYHFNPNDYNFQQAVKNVIATQMVKY
jgi:hypothetical protein